MPAVIYVFHYVLSWFSYPHEGEVIMYFTFILPMLLASAMLGQTLNLIAHEREASFVIVVFTSVIFLFLSGLATGTSWLCYYKALRDGPASVVVPIDKLSILVTVAFSYLVFHEKLTKKSALGLAAIVAGTLLMLL